MTTQAQTLLEFLDAACHQVRMLEADAKNALDVGKVDAYRECMLEKAKFLASLERQGQPYIAILPAVQQNVAAEGLRRFSASAMNALSVASVFYMSALLFPEDYVPGNPNDLEIFTESLRK